MLFNADPRSLAFNRLEFARDTPYLHRSGESNRKCDFFVALGGSLALSVFSQRAPNYRHDIQRSPFAADSLPAFLMGLV